MGALGGLAAGFTVWFYCLLLPSFAKSGWLDTSFLALGPFGIELLKPEQLFGVSGLDPISHALFWSLFLNVLAYVVLSFRFPPDAREAAQASLFVHIMDDDHSPQAAFWRGGVDVAQLLPLVRLSGKEPAEGVNADDVLRLAASAEVRSEHPLARAIVAAAAARGLALVDASGVEARPGRGLAARVAGHDILIGNARALGEAGIECESLAGRGIALAEQGRTPILVAIDGRAAALLAVADPIKPGAAEAIAALHRAGLKTAMISGDTQATARAVAGRLGIDEVRAEVLPEGKVAALRDIAGSGPVAFVGDGINDAPALAAADVGIAMGTGTDVAIESAEVVLMGGDPGAVATAITLSRATMRNIRQNLFWAFGYNVVLIPVAAGLMFPLGGPLLSPMLAAGAMALSSVFVVTNALRLRRA